MTEEEVVSIVDGSILDEVKKYVGPSISYTVFDADILMNINAAFFTLYQLGVGPQDKVFSITDNTATWKQFSDDETAVAAAKQYVYLKVRNVFDPPTSSYVLQAYTSQIQELEWRLRELATGVFEEEEDDDCGCCVPNPDPDIPDDGDSGDDEPTEPDPPVTPGELPIATRDRLGGVIIGENVNVDQEGRISIDKATQEEVSEMLDRVFGRS